MTARIHKITLSDVSRPFSPGIDCSPLYHSGVKKWVALLLKPLTRSVAKEAAHV